MRRGWQRENPVVECCDTVGKLDKPETEVPQQDASQREPKVKLQTNQDQTKHRQAPSNLGRRGKEGRNRQRRREKDRSKSTGEELKPRPRKSGEGETGESSRVYKEAFDFGDIRVGGEQSRDQKIRGG